MNIQLILYEVRFFSECALLVSIKLVSNARTSFAYV